LSSIVVSDRRLPLRRRGRSLLVVVIVRHRFVASSIRTSAAQRLVPGSVATLTALTGLAAALACPRRERCGAFDETLSELDPTIQILLSRSTLARFEIRGEPTLPRLMVSEQARLLGRARSLPDDAGLRVVRIHDALTTVQ
jgi:hypothetical protein